MWVLITGLTDAPWTGKLSFAGVWPSRDGSGRTSGPRVPLAPHVNNVKERLHVMRKSQFRLLKAEWRFKSVQTWDPFAPPGSMEAQSAPTTQRVCKWPHAASVEATMSKMADRVPHAVPASKYYVPTVETVPDKAFNRTLSFGGEGTSAIPFHFSSDSDHSDDDDDNDDPAASSDRPTTPPLPRAVPPSSSPLAVAPRRRAVASTLAASCWAPGTGADCLQPRRTQSMPRATSRSASTAASPKETPSGTLARSTYFNAQKTACGHDDIDHLPQFANMSREEVNSHVMPALLCS